MASLARNRRERQQRERRVCHRAMEVGTLFEPRTQQRQRFGGPALVGSRDGVISKVAGNLSLLLMRRLRHVRTPAALRCAVPEVPGW